MSETDLKDTLAALSEAATQGEWLTQATDTDGPDYGVGIVGGNLGGLVAMSLPWPTEIDSGDFARVEANAAFIVAIVNTYRSGQLVPVPSVEGWIVGNGSGTKWRTWKDGWSDWTDDPLEATRYARREDAEAVHAEDEDAWTVQPANAILAAMKGEGRGDG